MICWFKQASPFHSTGWLRICGLRNAPPMDEVESAQPFGRSMRRRVGGFTLCRMYSTAFKQAAESSDGPVNLH